MYTIIEKTTNYLVLLLAIVHVWLMVAEVFMWKSSLADDFFDYNDDEAETTAPLARSHGVYSGLLGLGLLWAFLATGPQVANLRLFFLSSALIAGLANGIGINRKFLGFQAFPAALALLLIFWPF